MLEGRSPAEAEESAEDVVLEIHGALVLARATRDEALFVRAIARHMARLQRKPMNSR